MCLWSFLAGMACTAVALVLWAFVLWAYCVVDRAERLHGGEE